ncbi:hypothetical protein MXB_1106 [Myxobolus squamalis]|nr:hypothetical protein MXB_1106 [Myxobolus squamalis]
MTTRDYEPDAIYTLESQLIIRIPEPYCNEIDEALDNDTLGERLNVEIDINSRFANVQWDGIKLYGKIVDLPCIIESNKTIDFKSIYKTGDISQILICSTEPFAELEDANRAMIPGGWTAKKFLWPHGRIFFTL